MNSKARSQRFQREVVCAAIGSNGGQGSFGHATMFPLQKHHVKPHVSIPGDDIKDSGAYSVSIMEKDAPPRIYAKEWRRHLRFSQERVADAIESTKGTVSKLENGGLSWRPEWLGKVAGVLGISPSDLFSPPPTEELHYVRDDEVTGDVYAPRTFGEINGRIEYSPSLPGASPELDVRAGAGEGMVGYVLPTGSGYSGHEVIAEWVFPPPFLRQELKGRPDRTIVMEVQSESMFPTLSPGDRVLVDLSQNRLSADGAIYLVSYDDGDPQVKRLHTSDEDVNKWNVLSDNPKVPLRLISQERIKILGRVVGRVSRL